MTEAATAMGQLWTFAGTALTAMVENWYMSLFVGSGILALVFRSIRRGKKSVG